MYINNSNLAELFRHALLRRVSKNYSGIEKLESCLLKGPAELFRVRIQNFAINERGGYNYNYNVNLHGRIFRRGFNTAIRFSKINNRVLPSIIFPISVDIARNIIDNIELRYIIYGNIYFTQQNGTVFHAEIIIIIIIIIIIVVIVIIIIRSLKQRRKYF